MKKLVSLFAVAFAGISMAWASASAPLTTARAIRSLSKAEAEQGLSVDFAATVTFYSAQQRNLFVQDGNTGMFVKAVTGAKLVPGDRVEIKGTTQWGYGSKVMSNDIIVLSHGATLKPAPATFDELIKGKFDTILVKTRGVVHSADLNAPSASHGRGATLRVLMDGGYVDVDIADADEQALSKLLDTEVEITGAAGGKWDGKLELTGVLLHVESVGDIRILKPAPKDPWSQPAMPIDKILSVYHVKNFTDRVKVSGTVTYYDPGSTLVLENGDRSLWIKTSGFAPMRIGDRAEATGFPGISDGFLVLTASETRDSGIPAPILPAQATWQQLASSRHIFDLVSIEGAVVMLARGAAQDEYVLLSDGHMFSAIYPHRGPAGARTAAMEVPVGARIRVTGICTTDNANPFGHEVPFNILMRTPGDITVLAEPSLLTVRNMGILVVVLLLAMIVVGARAWFIDRKMRSQLAELGYLVQRRGEILEDINKSRPLSETLERITELASFSLRGAPCWCKISDGARLGNYPPRSNRSGLRIAEHEIAAHTGPALGSILAAFDARTTPQPDEDKALAEAAELATVAIETARLHSDLVRRSEFDMLTDVQNRFSFERHLDELIDKARRISEVFGLIYIDFDDFKQMNDRHGHQFGDMYLQQAVARMKRQLRPGDLLARLGGDEFGVLVHAVRNRAEVGEIAARLERCFNEPFALGDHILSGSASIGIALYPEDAATKSSLMRSADVAMYVAKNSRHQRGRIPAGEAGREVTHESHL